MVLPFYRPTPPTQPTGTGRPAPSTVAKAFSRGGSPLRSTLPETEDAEQQWKSWVFALVTLFLAAGTGLFGASFFVTESVSLPRSSYSFVFVGGGVTSILWLACTSLSFLLLRGRWLKFILLILIPILLWFPLYLVGEYQTRLVILAILISALGIGFGWSRMSFRARHALSVRPFSESAQMIRWVLIALALAAGLLFLPNLASRQSDNPQSPPQIFSLVSSALIGGFRSVGLNISRETPLDKALELFLANFDRTFQAAPAVLKQALIRSQREFVGKLIFPAGTSLTGRETIEELLWRSLSRSGAVAWTVPLIVFFILLAPAILIRWVSAASAWVVLEMLIAIGFVRMGKELVEKEVVVLA